MDFSPQSEFAWTLLILHVTFVVLYFLLVSYDSSADASNVDNQNGHSHHLEENLKKYPGVRQQIFECQISKPVNSNLG